MVKNPLATAEDTGSSPWSGKIPHAAGKLSLCTTAVEAHALEPVLCNKRSHFSEEPTHHNWSIASALLKLEKA